MAGALGYGAGMAGLIYNRRQFEEPPQELKRFYVIEETMKRVATDLSPQDMIYTTLQKELQGLQSREGFEKSKKYYEDYRNAADETRDMALYGFGLSLASMAPFVVGLSRRIKELGLLRLKAIK